MTIYDKENEMLRVILRKKGMSHRNSMLFPIILGSYIRVDAMCFCLMPSESFRKTERTA